jgi:enoyl-[acyl-carrier protein] reductase I
MNEWGVLLPYRIWQRSVFSDYNDMADNKAYLESVARSFGYFLKGQKLELILFPITNGYKGWSSC